MREFKFRAWDKKHRVMVNVGGFANLDYPEDHKYRYVTNAGDSAGLPGGACRQWEDVELMQFTGLVDINLKEIYEGDILRNVEAIEYGNRVEAGELWEMEFGITMGCAGIWLYHNCLDTVPFDKTEVGRLVFNDDEGSQWFEVVGNIYENAELLEAKK